MLRRWLEYSATGMLESGEVEQREPDSEFEVYVINQIKAMGCEPVPQVGVAGYFIDIGIRHHNGRHGYLLGVECDGANYHSAKSARDRDRLRQEVLEGLGWRLHRIWSTDWFNNPHREAERLRQVIAQRLEQLKAKEQDYVQAADPAPNAAAAATPISALSARAPERPSRPGEGPDRETTQVRGHRQPASDTRTSRDQPLTVAAARDLGVSIGDTVRVTYLAGGKQDSRRQSHPRQVGRRQQHHPLRNATGQSLAGCRGRRGSRNPRAQLSEAGGSKKSWGGFIELGSPRTEFAIELLSTSRRLCLI